MSTLQLSPRRSTSRSIVATLAAFILLAALPATTVLAVAPNDDRSNATIVAALPFTDELSTADAGPEPEDPDCHGGGPTVWYSLMLDETTDVVADTFGSSYDTTLSVHVDEGGVLSTIACNDDFSSLQSLVGWTAEPGVTYLLMVGAYGSGEGGNLVFSIAEGTPPPPPEPLEVTVEVVGASLQRSTGHVAVDVSVSCSEPAWAFGSGLVRQRAGRTFIDGYGSAEFACGAEPTLMTIVTSHETGIFAGGSVDVTVYVDAYSETSDGFGFDTATLRMRMAR